MCYNSKGAECKMSPAWTLQKVPPDFCWSFRVASCMPRHMLACAHCLPQRRKEDGTDVCKIQPTAAELVAYTMWYDCCFSGFSPSSPSLFQPKASYMPRFVSFMSSSRKSDNLVQVQCTRHIRRPGPSFRPLLAFRAPTNTGR